MRYNYDEQQAPVVTTPTMGIYCIKNLINNKVYVGQSVNIEQRIRSHYWLSETSTKTTHLYNAIRKYGTDNFDIEILEITTDRSMLNELEYKWMAELCSCDREKGYNTRLDNGTTYVHAAETKGKIGDALRGVSKSEEHIANMSTSYKKGHVISPEILAKRNAAIKAGWQVEGRTNNAIANSGSFQKGHVPANLGVPTSDEAKVKMRAAKLGGTHSPETIEKRRLAIGWNRVYQFDLNLILVQLFDSAKEISELTNGKYLTPGIQGCCNGNKEYYFESVFKYERDIELIDTPNGKSFIYVNGDIPTKPNRDTTKSHEKRRTTNKY